MLRVAVVWLVLLPAPLFAQVKVTRILDLPETRVAQVEIPANDTRPLHAHPEALRRVVRAEDAPKDLLVGGERTGLLGPRQGPVPEGTPDDRLPAPHARTRRWVES